MCRKKNFFVGGSTLKHVVPWSGIKPVPSFIESMESYSLERQESPSLWLLKHSCYIWETVPYLCIKSFHVCYDWILYTFTITYFTRHLGNFQSSAGWTKLQWLGDAINRRVCVSVGQILRSELREQSMYVFAILKDFALLPTVEVVSIYTLQPFMTAL